MPDVRSFVVIALADEIVRRPELLRAFANRFDGRDDVTLVLYAETFPEGLVPLVEQLGLDTVAAVDMLALEGPPPNGVMHAFLTEEEPPAEFADLPAYGAADIGAIRTKARYLSACTMFKDEALYLREWIEFQRLVGFEHFYLYDNNSTDNSLAVLEPYVREGIATVIEWPLYPGQVQAFQHCVQTFGHESTWLAMIDNDEFLFSPESLDVREILVDYEAFGGLVVNMMQYGTSGHLHTPDGLALENFVRRADDETAVFLPNGLKSPELDKTDLRNYHPLNARLKSIVRPERVAVFGHPHYATYKPGSFAVNEQKQRVDGPMGPVSSNRIRINHYWTKSVEQCFAKFVRGDVKVQRKWPDEFLNRNEALNEVVDTSAVAFAPALRTALGLGPAPLHAEVVTGAERAWANRPSDEQIAAFKSDSPVALPAPVEAPPPRVVPPIIAEAGKGFAAELAVFVPWSTDEIKERLYYPGPIVEVPITILGGLPIRVRPGTSHVRTLRGTFDHLRRYHLPPDELDPKVIVDLGANIGTTVADYAHHYPDAYVVGVELDEDNAELARENVAAFGERTKIIHAGASAEDGELRYRRDIGNEWGFQLSETGDVAVRTLTLDSILREAGITGTVDYLKVDIEGAERDVLRAGGKWASRVRCLKVELHHGYTVEQAREDVTNLGLVPYVDAKHHACIVAVARSEKLLLVA